MTTKRKTILYIDDDRGARESLRMVLKYDHDILLADRGSSGLIILEKQHVDLLITGIRMPEMSGLELLQIVREKCPDLPVLVLAGYGDLATAVECIRLGAFDYIQKPFDTHGIQATVRRTLAYGDAKRSGTADESSPAFIEAQQYGLFNFKSFLWNKDDESILTFCNKHKGDETLADLIPILEAQMFKNRKSILVVDDERGPRESLRMVLKYDYNILLADGGVSGLEILEKQHVDLLISNISMPNMNGFEFVGIVREKYPFLPVLMLTGYYDLDRGVNSMKLGVFDYLSKPFDTDGIKTTIKHALVYGKFLASAGTGKNSTELSDADLHRWSEFKKHLFSTDDQQILTLFKKCDGDVVRAFELLKNSKDRSLHAFIDKLFSSFAPH